MILEMVNNEEPFKSFSIAQFLLQWNTIITKIHDYYCDEMPRGLKEIADLCLHCEADDRPNIKEVSTLLEEHFPKTTELSNRIKLAPSRAKENSVTLSAESYSVIHSSEDYHLPEPYGRSQDHVYAFTPQEVNEEMPLLKQ